MWKLNQRFLTTSNQFYMRVLRSKIICYSDKGDKHTNQLLLAFLYNFY